MADINPLPRLLDRLIMGSSHALNKIQFESFTDKSKLNAQPKLFIILEFHKANRTLFITDTGIGMTKEDLDAIGRSGNKEFMKALQAGADDISVIDQFSVSFYPAYLVVDKVIVTTKHNDDDQYVWESHAGGSFSITRDVSGEHLGRGTKITLFLKEEQLEYLEERKIKDLVQKYSEFIGYPIYLRTEKTPVLYEPEKEEEGDIVEVSYEWQLISEPKRFGTRKNHSVGQLRVEPTKSYGMLCKTIKDILGDKVLKVIAPESFDDSSSCRITGKRVLEVNPDSAIVEKLREMVETDPNDEFVKDFVQHLFETATALSTKQKKALWRKVAKGLTVCCGIIHVTAAVLSIVVPGCGGVA